jgi:hypothetical protein
MDEIPLMQVVHVLQEELHIPGLLGQNAINLTASARREPFSIVSGSR